MAISKDQQASIGKRMAVDVSVVIVNWNTRQLLLECIESLYEQTRRVKTEIIVVDNASSDGSSEAVTEQFPEVVMVVNEENLGFSKANNVGIRLAQGRYVCLVNSDIIALDGVLDKMAAFMDANPDIGVLGPKTFNERMQLRPTCRELPSLHSTFCQALYLHKLFPGIHLFQNRDMKWFDHNSVLDIESVSGCFMMVRREVIDSVGMLDEDFFIYGEDVDWSKRICEAGWRAVFYPEAQAIHYGGGSSSKAPIRFQIERLKADLHYWRKHKGLLGKAAFSAIMVLDFSLRFIAWLFIGLLKPRKSKEASENMHSCRAGINWLLFGRF